MPANCATYDDVNLILRLYELRRESKMRQAREWFVASFHPKSLEDVSDLCPPGSNEDAYFRMVVSYWDMVASFITNGVLQRECFFESGRELALAWLRISPFIVDMREARSDPTMWKRLEIVGKAYGEWLNKQAPGAYEAFARRMQ